MDEETIVYMYDKERYTLRHIAEVFGTNHHTVKRILLRHGVTVSRRNTLREFSKEHRDKIISSRKALYASGATTTWSKGKKMSRGCVLKNMRARLKYNVSLEWLESFDDIEKLKYLNKSLSRQRDCQGFTTDSYISFIERFYYDEKFNEMCDKWMKTKDKLIKPSLDHIEAKSKGGLLGLDNLQFISWLENRAKMDISQDKWNEMKKNIQYYL